MASYNAEIAIAVKGGEKLKQLQNEIKRTAEAVDSANRDINAVANRTASNLKNLASALSDARDNFRAAARGTEPFENALKDLVKAEQSYNSELRERNKLLEEARRQQGPSIKGERLTEGQQRSRESFQAFFADAAQQAKSISINALNTKTAWDTFFKEAAEVARSFDAQKLNTRTSWNSFFTEAAELANDIRSQTRVKQLNLRTSWTNFFTEAEEVANQVRNQTRVKQLNLRTSWNNFFTEAEAVANDVRNQTRVKQVNLRTSWSNFFTEAAQLAEDLRRQAARTVLRAQERDIFVQETISRGRSARIARERSAFLQGSSGTQQLGPLAGPGAFGFPVALPGAEARTGMSRLEIAKKKLEIIRRTAQTTRELSGLRGALRDMESKGAVAAQVANRDQERLNKLKKEELEIEKFIGRERVKQSIARRKRIVDNAKEARRRRQDAIGSGIIGGAFPLLFGQGGGAAVGGAAGGFGGGLLGGQFGFGLSLVGTQLGATVDQFVGKITELAGSLESTQSIFAGLEQAGFRVSDVTKEIVASYEEAGLFADAYQLAIDEINKRLGDDGAAKLQAYQDELNRVNSLVEDLSADLIAELLPSLTGTIRIILDLKDAFDELAQSPLFRLLGTIGKNVAFLKPDLILARVFSENARRQGAADGEVRIPDSVTRQQESAAEQRIRNEQERDAAAKDKLPVLNREIELLAAGNDILNENVQTAKRNVIQEKYLADLRKDGITDGERTLAEKQKEKAELQLTNQIRQAQQRKDAKAQSAADRAASKAKAAADRAAEKARREEERLQRRLKLLDAERIKVLEVSRFQDKIAAAVAAGDEDLAIRLRGEQRMTEIEQSRIKALVDVNDQREKDAINIKAATDKLAAHRQQERELADSVRLRAENYENTVAALENQLNITTATTRQERERLEIAQQMKELRDSDEFTEEQLSQIEKLKKDLNAANQPLNKFIVDSTAQLNDLEQVAVNVASGIGNAIGNSLNNAISGLIEGSTTVKEVFSDMLKSIGQVLVQEGTKMIATYIAIGIARAFAGLGNSSAGSGDLAARSNKIFDGSSLYSQPPVPFKANGGPVQGGQPYMVGERGPELFVPSSNGGVMRNEDMRQLMGRSPVGNAPAMNFTFETTNIGGQEFVSREQLEAAMVTTRRQAASDGAKRGMNMTLDRMQNSPRTRARVGIA